MTPARRLALGLCGALWGALCGCAADYAARPPPAYRGEGRFPVETVRPDAIGAACSDRRSTGCYRFGRVILPNPCDWPGNEAFAQLACHEAAHARGWPADHPR